MRHVQLVLAKDESDRPSLEHDLVEVRSDGESFRPAGKTGADRTDSSPLPLLEEELGCGLEVLGTLEGPEIVPGHEVLHLLIRGRRDGCHLVFFQALSPVRGFFC